MSKIAYFDPGLFKFLRQLKKNNNREWFQKNKARYEEDVRDPLLRFIADFARPLHKISAHFTADPRPMGGSLFRIYRDTRFSKDKSPYKTMAAAHFRHEAAGDVHAPGFYLHLEPGDVSLAVGIWQPDADELAKVRRAIVSHPEQWKRVTSGKAFKKAWSYWGDKLKRPPAGFDPQHPFIEDLKRKDFVVVLSLTEEDACKPGFLDRTAELYRTAAPFVKFLTEAVGLEF
jgi:uncharacterized protein (TIGR02453 family)